MTKTPELDEVKSEFLIFSKWFISGLIDSVFLILWVCIQWGAQKIISRLELIGVSQIVFNAFQILFALSTLLPVIIYFYVDTRVMLLRAKKRIHHETELSKVHTTNDND
jgi:ABC-type transport system involved in Fe-S cluster assembly fused permease/ATPase subunit